MHMLPGYSNDRSTKSEAEAFKLIKESKAPSDYYCLHSLGIARHERKEYAEADFVIVGPLGVFCIEVKGGEVKRRGGVWEIGWPGKSYTSTEGPFKQAQSTRWPLINHIKNETGIDLRKTGISGWGVVFPSIVFDISDPEWDPDVVYDQRDKNKPFFRYIERLGGYFSHRAEDIGRKKPTALKPNQVKDIVTCLRGDFDKVQSIAGLIGESRRELIELSREQYKVLDIALHKDNPRLICDGGAGTGKTLIAREAAIRMAEEGHKVLLVCFNDNISRHLKRDCKHLSHKFEVWSIYQLLSHYIRLGGKRSDLEHARSEHTPEKLFLEVYPRLFEGAIENLIEQDQMPEFDYLVIDEGQDILNATILDCLNFLLAEGFENGRWAIFLDSKIQPEVYGKMDPATYGHISSFGAAKTVLRENYRNPETIVSEMCLLANIPIPVCMRSIPSEPEVMVATDAKGGGKRIANIVTQLLKDNVLPEEITILSCRRKNKSCLALSNPIFGAKVVWLDELDEDEGVDAITASTVSAFKGLENEVIILTDLPSPVSLSDWDKSMIYVGMTRARTKLFLIVDEEFLEYRHAKLSEIENG